MPGEADVVAAIDDPEALYEGCGAKGSLADSALDFMKEKLTIDGVNNIETNLATQQPPFIPPSVEVGHSTFPT